MNTTKTILFIFFIVILPSAINAQEIKPAQDITFIQENKTTKPVFQKRNYMYKNEKSFIKKYNPISLIVGSLLYTYQNTISQQLSANCLYEPSCSDFGKKAIKEYGIFKGTFIAADRLTRCNKIAGQDIHPISINPHNHKANDPVSQYE